MSDQVDQTSSVYSAVDTLPAKPAPTRPSIAKLVAALALAQTEICNPMKNREVKVLGKEGKSGFGYEYAELCAVTEILRQPLAKNGLVYTQTPIQRDGLWLTHTRIFHESEATLDFFYPLHRKQNMSEEQGFAAGFTYSKRQALKGIFGIADDTEDKDAQDDNPNATIKPKEKKSAPVAQKAAENQPPKESRPNTGPTVVEALDRAPNAARALQEDKRRSIERDLEQKPATALGRMIERTRTDGTISPRSDFEPIPLLDRLVSLVKAEQIEHKEVTSIILRVTGRSAKSTDLTSDELERVIDYIEKFKTQTDAPS
jgi:hypothetical protein